MGEDHDGETLAPPPPPASASPDAAVAAAEEDAEALLADGSETLVGDASMRFRAAAPGIDVDLGGPPDPACTGLEIALAVAVVDVRCAIDSARAKKLRALLERDGGVAGLRQEARVIEGNRVALRIVNGGGSTLLLPVGFHGKLPAFSVLAEDERHTLYELAPPPLALRDPGEGSRSHVARIALPPGGAASATLTITPAIVRVLGRGAGDRCKGVDASAPKGPCDLAALPKGTYVLHVGELLTDLELGAPARVTWSLP